MFDPKDPDITRMVAALCLFQVWISYAQFELSVGGPENVARARDVYRRANITFKQADEKEERLMLLESWKEFEVTKLQQGRILPRTVVMMFG